MNESKKADPSINEHPTAAINQLNESKIEYNLYIVLNKEKSLDINEVYLKLIERVESMSQNYIWNNNKFQLKKPIECDKNSSDDAKYSWYACHGCIDFGDNLEDEWFIVYMLFKLTSEYTSHASASFNLIAQVKDNDGEFLLIHAANYLPEWASSAADDCMNSRVYIFEGRLHIIPPATSPSQITYLPASGSIENPYFGAKIVVDFPNITVASNDIQECLKKRIHIYEANKINLMFHKASCTIPAKLTWFLKKNPGLISSAINSFCEKDPKDLKLCRTLEFFKPVNLVNYRVNFTKHLYGKLKYSNYKPEKRHNWPPLNKISTLDTSSDASHESNVSSLSIARERSNLGFKLTCAFEILFKKLQNDNNTNKSFDSFIKKLKNLGYFKDYIENSKSYNELMEKARQSYCETHQLSQNANTNKGINLDEAKQTNQKNDESSQKSCEPSTTSTSSSSSNDDNLLKSYSNLFDNLDFDDFINEEYVVKLKEEICSNTEKDDSDDWLVCDAPQLDDYLEMYSRGDISSTYDFRIISNTLRKFLQSPKAKSDLLDGTAFQSIDKNEEKLIDFNVDSIKSSLNNILNKEKSGKNLNYGLDEEHDDDEENDSFYEIDEESLDNLDGVNESKEDFKDYMDLMDSELRGETSLSRVHSNGNSKDKESSELEIDLNLVSNALESYSSQLGYTGPISNILKSMGL